MSDTIEQQCLSKGVKLTEQRRIIAKGNFRVKSRLW